MAALCASMAHPWTVCSATRDSFAPSEPRRRAVHRPRRRLIRRKTEGLKAALACGMIGA